MPPILDPAPASLENAHKRYGALVALDGVDLSLQPGRVLALLGPNGAGKSTAVSLMLGLQRSDAGRALLFGQSPDAIAMRRRVGVMLQSAALPDTLTVGELLAQTRGYYSQALSMADCAAIAGLEGLLPRRYGALSGGQQRRVQFALAICGRPEVLFLDEPTTGLDIQARRQLWAAIRERAAAGCAILLTTHYLEEAEALADDVAVLQAGHIVARGSVAQIRASVLQRCIRAQTDLDADAVAGWPGVHGARRDGAVLEIQAEPAEPIVARLLQADPQLADLEVRRAGLADAFLAITQSQEAA
ncbi:ABC-2 type transport system ATP-binding protein [Pseudoxanthomonas sp. GM95]|uniref:ABC transporter ATP-binding protein n=1 Tax=Pseudoxanthomonas sp. GM95 TaxID=1881043 RepID=UPI0008AE2933|nr:ABC transporter ATP-binding protein [Pseudoxanthomonas sp. GM95]SEL50752.1 ABC-2 type transport system ATP-binding protein [Pseudoxanthomonas sp. GM95]